MTTTQPAGAQSPRSLAIIRRAMNAVTTSDAQTAIAQFANDCGIGIDALEAELQAAHAALAEAQRDAATTRFIEEWSLDVQYMPGAQEFRVSSWSGNNKPNEYQHQAGMLGDAVRKTVADIEKVHGPSETVDSALSSTGEGSGG